MVDEENDVNHACKTEDSSTKWQQKACELCCTEKGSLTDQVKFDKHDRNNRDPRSNDRTVLNRRRVLAYSMDNGTLATSLRHFSRVTAQSIYCICF